LASGVIGRSIKSCTSPAHRSGGSTSPVVPVVVVSPLSVVSAVVIVLPGPPVVGSGGSPVVLVVVASVPVEPVTLPSLVGAVVGLVLVLSVVDAPSVLASPPPPHAAATITKIQAEQ